MPLLDPTTEQFVVDGTGYGFSATRLENLGAAEYTLVCIAADTSASVAGVQQSIENCVSKIVQACRLAPRADHLMLRLVSFNRQLSEVHGFRPLMECHPESYTGALPCRGCTALYDASHNAVESVRRYGKQLTQHGFLVNAIVFIITDGDDNASSLTVQSVKESLGRLRKDEELESLTTILVGAGIDSQELTSPLRLFSQTVGMDRFIHLDRADPSTLAALADFVSQHIQLQSRALGTGTNGPVSLSF